VSAGLSARGDKRRVRSPRTGKDALYMTPVVELIVLLFVAASGGIALLLLVRTLFRPKPPRRLLTLVIEERDVKRPAPPVI